MKRFKHWQSNIVDAFSSTFSHSPNSGLLTPNIVQLARNWVQKGTLAVLDQGIFSGSNLVANILMARWMITQAYGAYSYVFSIFLLISSFYSVLLLEPLSIFGPSRYKEMLDEYLRKITQLHVRWSMIIGVLGLSAAGILYIINPQSSLHKAIIGFSFAQGMILYFWLKRRSCYVNFQISRALQGTITYAILLLVGIGLLQALGHLTPLNGFLVFGIASLVGGTVVIPVKNENELSAEQGLLSSNLIQENWKYGRWLIVSSLLFWLTNHAYHVLIGSLVGLTEAGTLKALQNLTAPVIQINTALGLLFIPWASRRYTEGGWRTLKRDALLFSALTVMIGAIYFLLILVLGVDFVRVIYNEKYITTSWILPYLASVPIVAGLTSGWMTALRIMEKTSLVMIVDVIGASFTVTAGIILIYRFGILGAAIGIVFSTACRIPALVFIWRKIDRQAK